MWGAGRGAAPAQEPAVWGGARAGVPRLLGEEACGGPGQGTSGAQDWGMDSAGRRAPGQKLSLVAWVPLPGLLQVPVWPHHAPWTVGRGHSPCPGPVLWMPAGAKALCAQVGGWYGGPRDRPLIPWRKAPAAQILGAGPVERGPAGRMHWLPAGNGSWWQVASSATACWPWPPRAWPGMGKAASEGPAQTCRELCGLRRALTLTGSSCLQRKVPMMPGKVNTVEDVGWAQKAVGAGLGF